MWGLWEMCLTVPGMEAAHGTCVGAQSNGIFMAYVAAAAAACRSASAALRC